MNKYLAIFHGPASEEDKNAITPEQEQELMAAWKEWAQKNKESILDAGTPLGKTKQVTKSENSDITNDLVTYTIVQAESHDAAAEIFATHPHTTLFPGTSIEVMACLPAPKDLF
jgi:hypothetical protein